MGRPGRARRAIRQHTSAYVRIRQHTPAYVSIREHTAARAASACYAAPMPNLLPNLLQTTGAPHTSRIAGGVLPNLLQTTIYYLTYYRQHARRTPPAVRATGLIPPLCRGPKPPREGGYKPKPQRGGYKPKPHKPPLCHAPYRRLS